MPSAIAAQQGTLPAAAGLGTPDIQTVSASPAAATTPGSVAVDLTSGLPDPRLSVPGAALAGTAQQRSTAECRSSGRCGSDSGVSARAYLSGGDGADSGCQRHRRPARRFGCTGSGYSAATGGLRLHESIGRLCGPREFLTGRGAGHRAGHRGCPGNAPAPVVAAVAGVTASVTAADAVSVSGSLPGLPGVAPAESRPSTPLLSAPLLSTPRPRQPLPEGSPPARRPRGPCRPASRRRPRSRQQRHSPRLPRPRPLRPSSRSSPSRSSPWPAHPTASTS